VTESKITFHDELTLTVPDGCMPIVSVEIEPSNGACLIYGYSAEDALQPVHVVGSQARLNLPFVKPTVYIRRLHGTASIKLILLAWKDPRRGAIPR
jgi:hypothetical protein